MLLQSTNQASTVCTQAPGNPGLAGTPSMQVSMCAKPWQSRVWTAGSVLVLLWLLSGSVMLSLLAATGPETAGPPGWSLGGRA